MFVQLPQFTLPLAAAVVAEAMGAVDAELAQGSFQAQIGDVRNGRRLTQRTRLAILFDSTDARGTKAMSTAEDEVRLAKDLEADGALALKLFRRQFDEIALVSSSLPRLWQRLLVIGGLTSHFFDKA